MPHDPLVEHSLELLAPLGGMRARRMFGGHGLYAGELFVALIAFDRLYLKADAASRERFAAAGCEPFVYESRGRAMALNFWTVPADAMESPHAMLPWARLALQAALSARAAKAALPKPSAKTPPSKRPPKAAPKAAKAAPPSPSSPTQHAARKARATKTAAKKTSAR